MFEPTLLKYDAFPICDNHRLTHVDNDGWWHPIEDIVLMQCTGLRDGTKWEDLTLQEREDFERGLEGKYQNNPKEHWMGKLIFEDDIVKYTKPGGHCSTGVVKYVTEYARWEYWHIKQKEGFPIISDNDNLKIIGNVHDNPELLMQGA